MEDKLGKDALTKDALIAALQLEPHIEGGYFRRTFSSNVASSRAGRHAMSTIYYLLSADSPIGYWHKNQSDIMHFHHCGAALDYCVIDTDGRFQEYRLGNNVLAGDLPQLMVNGNCWKATRLCDSNTHDFALISEAVAPAFDYADMELGTEENLCKRFPQYREQIAPYLK